MKQLHYNTEAEAQRAVHKAKDTDEYLRAYYMRLNASWYVVTLISK